MTVLSHTDMTQTEIDAAMADIALAERASIVRASIGDGFCFFCQRDTLRVTHTDGMISLSCPCRFTQPPPT